MLVTVRNCCTNALFTLKLRHGLAVLQATGPPGVGTEPVLTMLYPAVFTPITFCLLAILKKSASNSTLYLSRNLNLLATPMSTTQVIGKRKTFFPQMSLRFLPPY